ncbi:MAG: helix-turn-helix domain-containing protein [Bryobacteraceae bacterium]|nr:helix-turn-helix domain-containing protein [Bryobacteraceae bacterium]
MGYKQSQSGSGDTQTAQGNLGSSAGASERSNDRRLLNEFQVAEILGVSVATVRRWRLRGRGPRFVKVAGTLVRYSTTALDEWLAVQPTGGEGTAVLASSAERLGMRCAE